MVQDGPAFEKGVEALNLDGVTVVHVARPCDDASRDWRSRSLRQLPVTEGVEQSIANITPIRLGKLLFTSGSTECQGRSSTRRR